MQSVDYNQKLEDLSLDFAWLHAAFNKDCDYTHPEFIEELPDDYEVLEVNNEM